MLNPELTRIKPVANRFNLPRFFYLRENSWLRNLLKNSIQVFRRIIFYHNPASFRLGTDAHLGAERLFELVFDRLKLMAHPDPLLVWRVLELRSKRLGLTHRTPPCHDQGSR